MAARARRGGSRSNGGGRGGVSRNGGRGPSSGGKRRPNGNGRRGTSGASRSRGNGDAKVIRYAVIGLGYISQAAVLPAFQHARANSRLTALVSDDSKKLKLLGRRYGASMLCGYDEYDALLASGAIDAVYIALPNSLHKDFTVRAANAGIHVLCEKPLADTPDECMEMIDACKRNNVRLMTAYRLHFERASLEVANIARSGKLGELRYFSSSFSQQVAAGNVRLKKDLGGGPVQDLGIYCINAARSLFAAEPLEVLGSAVSPRDARFREVPETVSAIMKFPRDRTASFTCSFGSADRSELEIVGTKGSIVMDPAYELAEGLAYTLRIGKRTREKRFQKSDQFAPELLYFSNCVLAGRDPEPNGEEGMADVRVIQAIMQSVESGRWVELDIPQRKRRPMLEQAIRRPGVQMPSLVNAASPSG
jgi:predicted dehydrogenase